MKPTPIVFSFVAKQGLAGKWLPDEGPSNPPGASYGNQLSGPISPMAYNEVLRAAFCKGKLGSGNKPQPQCGLAQDPNACLVLT